jgi:hypothetical protein
MKIFPPFLTKHDAINMNLERRLAPRILRLENISTREMSFKNPATSPQVKCPYSTREKALLSTNEFVLTLETRLPGSKTRGCAS